MPEERKELFLTKKEIEIFNTSKALIGQMVTDLQAIHIQHIKDVDNGKLQEGISSLIQGELWITQANKAK